MIEILYKSKNAVVVYKPPFVPSQPDPSGDDDMMILTAKTLKDMGESDALWLVHRLDRVVGGLLDFARNKKSAAKLSELVACGGLSKEYLAVCEGEAPKGELSDFLYKDALKGKSFVTDRKRAGVKEAKLISTPLQKRDGDNGVRSLVKIELITGRFHQIRAQLSSRSASIVGDGKYGSRDKLSASPALFAYRLSFKLFGDTVNVVRFPDLNNYPWSLFDKTAFDQLKGE